MKKLKVFISQPMAGKEKEEILAEREQAVQLLKNHFRDHEVEIIDSFVENAGTPLECLAKSLELMAKADLAYFMAGWSRARGCCIEYTCATAYDVTALTAEDFEKIIRITKGAAK